MVYALTVLKIVYTMICYVCNQVYLNVMITFKLQNCHFQIQDDQYINLPAGGIAIFVEYISILIIATTNYNGCNNSIPTNQCNVHI